MSYLRCWDSKWDCFSEKMNVKVGFRTFIYVKPIGCKVFKSYETLQLKTQTTWKPYGVLCLLILFSKCRCVCVRVSQHNIIHFVEQFFQLKTEPCFRFSRLDKCYLNVHRFNKCSHRSVFVCVCVRAIAHIHTFYQCFSKCYADWKA